MSGKADTWEHLRENKRISQKQKDQFEPPFITSDITSYSKCVSAVSHLWCFAGMGSRVYLIPSEIKAKSKTSEAFLTMSLDEVDWAIDLYQQIVIRMDNEKQKDK